MMWKPRIKTEKEIVDIVNEFWYSGKLSRAYARDMTLYALASEIQKLRRMLEEK